MTSAFYDVLIIGAGITGTALLHQLSKFTNLKSLGLIEQYDHVAQVNSHARNNSQTIHYGDIETNYNLEKALSVKKSADILIQYAKAQQNTNELIHRLPKMVLGVGQRESEFLRKRFEVFSQYYPDIRLFDTKDIGRIEPYIIKDRQEEVVAIGTEGHYSAVNYQTLADSFIKNAQKNTDKTIDVRFKEKVLSITQPDSTFHVKTTQRSIKANFVVVSTGAHSLLFAQKMGYGLEFSCLPIGGSYYFTPACLNGKVYTIQNDKLPFAAVHGDHDIIADGKTRFGPTAIILPVLERYNLKTLTDFLQVLKFDTSVAQVLYSLMKEPEIRSYLFKNILFEIPYINRRLFLKDVRKIVPSLQVSDLTFAKGFGGLRPQLIDRENKRLLLGEAKINSERGIIFNMTPSPGGTSCLDNANKDVKIIQDYLGCDFNTDAFHSMFPETHV